VNVATVVPAERILQELGMPPEEIRAVLDTDDPRQIRRHLELHRERLVEELIDRRGRLAALGRELEDAALDRAGIDRAGSRYPAAAGGSSTEPSSPTVQEGLWATSHGWPSGSTNTPE
jgi:DNA-binding transcriptional MerR regulator